MARYSDEEAKEILRRAIERHEAEKEGFAAEDLVDAARELGIPPEMVERAAIEVRANAGVEARRKARRQKERQRMLGRVASYAAVNAFLAVLDYMTGPGWWVQWPLIIWGFFLVMSFISLVHPAQQEKRDNRAERRYQAKLAREARARAKREAKKKRRGAETEFELAVEQGVAALLAAAAKGIEGLVSQPPGAPRRPPGEFQKYVERRMRGEPSPPARAPENPPPSTQAPRARVPEEPDELEELEEHEEPARRSRAHRRR